MPPSASLLGWTLEEADPDRGTVVVRFEARPDFTNMLGHVQGGFLTAMLDDTMGPAVLITLTGSLAPTLGMNVSFFEPARVGPLWGHGRALKVGKANAFAEADLVDGDGSLVARGSSTMYIMSAP